MNKRVTSEKLISEEMKINRIILVLFKLNLRYRNNLIFRKKSFKGSLTLEQLAERLPRS